MAQVFVTSKLNNGFHRPDDARRAFEATLRELGTDYVDLFLIHWPLPTLYDGDFVSTWTTLEEFKADGRARSIGVSNFQIHHLQELARETETTPAVNQIEVHPYFTNDAVRAYGVEHDIATEGWSPIARGKVLGDPVVMRIARATGAHPAQVVLRWHIERGDIVFPKSVHPQRMKENFEIFDFEINDEEIEALTALDNGEAGRTRPEPRHLRLDPGLSYCAAGVAFQPRAAPSAHSQCEPRRRVRTASIAVFRPRRGAARQHLEHPLTAGLGGVVGGGAQEPVRQRQFGDGAPGLGVLHQQRPAGVGQVVLLAQRAHPHRDLGQPPAGQIRVEVVLDLVGQVAGHERHHRAGVDVGAAQHLAQIPLTLGSPPPCRWG